jgi:hypothetical protein
MKMKPILTYTISLIFLLVSFTSFSQNEPVTDTTAVTAPANAQRYGIRLGADVHRLAKSLYDDNYKGFEVVADYRLTKKIYVAGELGTEKQTVDDEQINFTTNGSYFKVGFDYNAFENWLDMENMIYVGVRYGVSTFSQRLNSYNVYQNSDVVNTADTFNYFGQATIFPNQEYSGLSAHWVEVVGGVKAELFNNLFIGFSVRLNNLVSNKKPENFDNLFIPGFNRTYAGNFGVGFNYSLSYFIPLYKKANKVAEKQ